MHRTFMSCILIILIGLVIAPGDVLGQAQRSLSADTFSATPANPGNVPREQGAKTKPSLGLRHGSGQSVDLEALPQQQAAPRVLPPPGFSTDSSMPSVRATDRHAPSHGTTPTTSSFVKTSITMICLLVLAAAVARVFKKHGPVSIVGLPEEAIEILGKRPLDRQKAIHLVRCGSRILVLGTSVNEINTLAEITDPIEVDFLAGVCRHKENKTGMVYSFRQLFRKQIASGPKTQSPKVTVPLSVSVDEPFPATSANDHRRQTIAG